MIPGEYLLDEGDITLNAGRATCVVQVANTGDRPVQVGSHFHFFEVNDALQFDRSTSPPARRCASSPASTARCSWWRWTASAACTASMPA